MTNTEITIRQTEAPSRSKMAGPCWIAIDDTYASEKGRTVAAEVGEHLTVTGKLSVRKPSGSKTLRGDWKIEVTGDPTDTATVGLWSGQGIEATITGARRIEA